MLAKSLPAYCFHVHFGAFLIKALPRGFARKLREYVDYTDQLPRTSKRVEPVASGAVAVHYENLSQLLIN